MNSERYQQTLEGHLLPFMQIQCKHFLKDISCHASKKTRAFLVQQSFNVMDWPGNCPDLNPIENQWNIFFHICFWGFLCILCTSAAPQRPAHGTVSSQVATHLRTDRVGHVLGRSWI